MERSEDKQAIIDLAGRNRMLSQRMIMLAARWNGGEESVRTALLEAVDLLDQSMEVLRNGGKYPGVAETIIIPPVPEEVVPALEQSEQKWAACKEAVLAVYHERGEEAASKGLAYLYANSDEFLHLNNAVVLAYKKLYDRQQANMSNGLLVLSLLSLIPLIYGVFLVWYRIRLPLLNLIAQSKLITQGKLMEVEEADAHDELALLSQQLNEQSKTLREIARFAESIGRKDFSLSLTPRSEADELSLAILRMRDQLRRLNEEERQQQRMADGTAHFSDLCQKEYESIDEFCRTIIRELTDWLDANQGAIFTLESDQEGNEWMEPRGVFAWERYKKNGAKVSWGEGLVGRAWQEKDTLFLTEVPDRYINITSGLGKANPNCILIVPIMQNQEVVGVLELAAFHVLRAHEIDFAKKVCEILGVTISTRRINARTRELLEESQDYARQMQMQEEEMRQNLEELEATQEDMRRRSEMMQEQLQSIYDIGLAHVEFDMAGHIEFANSAFLQCMGYNSLSEIKGRHHRIFMSPEQAASAEYAAFWDQLRRGEPVQGEFWRKSRTGEDVLIKGAYSVQTDGAGNPLKVVKFALDITPERTRAAEEEVLS